MKPVEVSVWLVPAWQLSGVVEGLQAGPPVVYR